MLAAAVVAVVAFWARAVYVPPFADRHVAASEEKYHYDVGIPGEWFSAWSLGDGQAYVLIALDPTGDKLAEEVEISAYRFTRAGYGWATWVFSLGRARLVPYALAVVGGLAVVANLAVAVRLRERLGPRAWILLINPAVYMGFAGDTSEPLGVLFLTLAMSTGSWVAAVALGVSRPTYLAALWGRWRTFLPGLAGTVLIVTYGLLALRPERLLPGGGLALPLVAFVRNWSIWGTLLAASALATLVVGWLRRDWAWALSALFVLCFGVEVLVNPTNAWRTAGFLPVLWAFGPNYERGPAVTGNVGSEATVWVKDSATSTTMGE